MSSAWKGFEVALLQNVVGRGTHAARPAAGSAGVLYFETDTCRLVRDSGTAWEAYDVPLLFTAKGDLLVYDGGAAQKLPVGSNGEILTADSTQASGLKWAAPAPATLTSASGVLGADVTMTSSATWYDGPSVSLAAGTWLVAAQMAFSNPGTNNSVAARLYDGTNTYALAGMTQQASWDGTLPLCALITPTGTITLKIQGYSVSVGGVIMRAQVSVAVGNKATQLSAIKVG